MKKWIGVDLDGTLAKIEGTSGVSIGAPVPDMVKRVKRWLDNGQPVKILTARRLDERQRRELNRWLKRQGLEGCEATNSKDMNMKELWDDNAIRVERNTGKPCSGCQPNNQNMSGSISAALSDDIELTDC